MQRGIVRKAGSPSAGGFVVEGRRVALENDAVDDNGCPVLFACTCGLPRIKRFDTALRLQSGTGRLICFDFQMDALRKCCEDRAQFQTIGLKNGKGGFVHKTQKIVFDSFWTAAAAFCLTLRRRVHRAVYPQPHRMEKRWRHTWLWNSTGDAVFYPVGQF